MTTLLWERPTKFEPYHKMRFKDAPWKDRIARVEKRATYRIAVSGSPEAIEALLALDSITPAKFDYKPMKKPVKMVFGGIHYDLWSIKKGAPK